MENATNAGSNKAVARQSARATRCALAPYAESGVEDNAGDSPSLTTYQWLDLNAHTVRASAIDLGLSDLSEVF